MNLKIVSRSKFVRTVGARKPGFLSAIKSLMLLQIPQVLVAPATYTSVYSLTAVPP